VFAVLRDPLARQLAVELANACAHAVAGRYPLVRASRDEVPREEFARTFAAGGLLDAFFERHLAPYVDMSARPWAFRGATREQAGESLVHFQRANAIRDAFFSDGGRRLGLRIELRLLELDPAIGEFTLDVDGQQPLRFRRDARAPQTLQWPGPGAGRVRLQTSGPGGPGTSYVFEGPWALLRLLDRVRIEPGREPERFALVFDIEGRKARFEARGTPLNPALREELERFQCPKRL
jgi:type VI secretion system protein ImpL